MPDSYAATGEGLLLIANGIDAVLAWDGYSTNAPAAGLIRPTTAVSAVGSGVGALSGSYIAYVTYVREDGFESSMSDVSGGFVLNLNAQIDYTAIPVSPDPRVVSRRIYRNTDGQTRTVYLDVEIADNVTTTATGTLSDTILQAGLSFALLSSENLLQSLNNNPPPDTKPFVAFHQNQGFLAGTTTYAEGSCEVVTGSTTVTGRGTNWKSNWTGRLIYIDGADRTYEIDSVSESLQTITLTTNYTGTTNLFAGYAIRPTPGESSAMYFTPPGEPEAWPPLNAISIPDEDDEVTGLMPMFGFLYIVKRRSIYKFTSQNDPLQDGYLYLNARRGCINHRCFAVIDDVAYMLDERGVHRFTGGAESQDVSGEVQDLFRDGTGTPINWNASRFFHAAHSPGELCIRFFVAFRGDYLPRHALCYCYSLNRWWIEEYHRPIGASALGQAGRSASSWGTSGEMVYLGSDAGDVFALIQQTPDCATASTAQSFTATAGGFETASVNGELTSDMIGASVVHRSLTKSLLQTRRITAVSGQTITVSPPWLVMPEAKDTIVVGGFPYYWQTNGLRYVNSETTAERGVEIFFKRSPGSYLDLEIFHDSYGPMVSAISIPGAANFGVATEKGRTSKRIDLSKKEGFAIVKMDGLRESTTDGRRVVSIGATGIGGNKDDRLSQIVVKGVAG